MSDATPRLGLPDLPGAPELFPEKVSDAFWQLDAVTDLYLKGRFVNDPPGSASDGDVWLVGGTPGAGWGADDFTWKLAMRRDGAWVPLAPFNGLSAFVEGENRFIVYQDGAWTDADALISAAEASIASAATCDIGAAGSLFVAVTGTTTVTSFGSAANTLRFVRFAGALTLTHDATSLVLPGGASIATAAGDAAIFASDGSGNWRCRGYGRANGQPVATALSVASLTASGAVSGTNLNPSNAVTTGNTAGANRIDSGGASGTKFRFLNSGDAIDGIDIAAIARNGTRCANIGTDGSLLVGTATNGGWTGNAAAEFKGAVNGLSSWLTNPSGGAALIVRVDATSAALADFRFNGATQVGSISTNGTATTYSTTSDARLKTVPAEQASYRGAIKALWVGDFTWRDSGAPGFGVLAQQAWEVMPHHQGVTRPQADDGPWQASAEPFGLLGLWGVKDLYALVDALAARVAALEAAHAVG